MPQQKKKGGLDKLKEKVIGVDMQQPENDPEMDKAAAGSPPTYQHAQNMNDMVHRNAQLESEQAANLEDRKYSNYLPHNYSPILEEYMRNKFGAHPVNNANPVDDTDWSTISKNFYMGSQQPSNIPSVEPKKSGLAAMKGQR